MDRYELDTGALRRDAEAIDAEHRQAMSTVVDELGDQLASAVRDERFASRRAFLRRAALGGAVVGAGTAAVSAADLFAPAFAATSNQPTDADRQLAGFAQGLELAAATAYDNAKAGNHDANTKTVLALFAEHHRQHAQALASIAARYGSGQPNATVARAFAVNDWGRYATPGLLSSALALENAAVSTYLYALGLLTGTDGAALMAAILPIESRHAVVIAQATNANIAAYVPSFETITNAATPAQFPA